MAELVRAFVDLIGELVKDPPALFNAVPAAWLPLLIFALRSVDQGLATIRMLVNNQGRVALSWFLALIQSFIFLSAIAGVLGQVDNLWNVIGFGAGSGMGSVLGLALDRWSPAGHTMLRIVSPSKGSAIVERLRRDGYGATELPGQGKDGTVTVILTAVPKRKQATTRELIVELDPAAFVTTETVQVLGGGRVL